MKTELSTKIFSDGIEKLQCIFGPITKEKAAVYYRILNFIPCDSFPRVIEKLLRTHDKPYFPFPAQILSAYEATKKRFESNPLF